MQYTIHRQQLNALGFDWTLASDLPRRRSKIAADELFSEQNGGSVVVAVSSPSTRGESSVTGGRDARAQAAELRAYDEVWLATAVCRYDRKNVVTRVGVVVVFIFAFVFIDGGDIIVVSDPMIGSAMVTTIGARSV